MKKVFKNLLFVFIIVFSASASSARQLDALFGYSFADEFDVDSGDIESEDAFTLGIRIKDEIQRGFGYNVGFGLDTIRDFKYSDGEIGFFLLEGNATLILDQIRILYIFAGLNYPFVYKDSGVAEADPVLGVQFGTGVQLSGDFGAELAFRTVNFELGSTDANLWGFAIRGYYTFAGL